MDDKTAGRHMDKTRKEPARPKPTQTIPPPAWRLTAYVRVSTPEQARPRHSGMSVQETSCRQWAIANGYRVMRVHTDVASGAGEPALRPGMVAALDDIKEGRSAGVIVQRLDRFSRDLIGQESFLAEVRRHGGKVFSCSPAESQLLREDAGDPMRKALRQMVGIMGEYERALVRLRLEAGKEKKRAAGGSVGGRPPLGMRVHGGQLVADAQEQSAIVRAVELRSVGHSYREIAGILQDEGYRNKAGGESWHPETVRRLCQRHAPEASDETPGPWNGYDLGLADPEWSVNPDAIQSDPQ